jgi:endonuclease YncB( thermonuclease family)
MTDRSRDAAQAFRLGWFFLVLPAIMALSLLSAGRSQSPQIGTDATLTGHATAHDGDDLAFGDVRVRLWGISAPEDRRGLTEPGGPEARAALAALIEGRRITCHLTGTTAGRSLRPVARCFAGGQDLAEALVRTGWARDCPAHSGGAYATAEAEARASGRDLAAGYPLPGYCGEGE